jgi:Flp pilus assembly pilin Flp
MADLYRAKSLQLQVRIWADAFRADMTAQDLVEYALMAGFVAVAAGALMPGVATNISRIFSSVGSVLFNSKNQGS